MTIEGLLNNARQVQQGMQNGTIVRDVLQTHEADIIDLQRTQLLEGKGSDGKDIHPFYTEDVKPSGWFNTKKSAENYKAWKQTLSYPKNVQRNPNAPNLYITGVFHNDLGVSFGTDSVMVKPDTAYAAKIMQKYGFNIFGLSMESWGLVFDEKGARQELIEKLRMVLWQ
jgi:hypothetical protein